MSKDHLDQAVQAHINSLGYAREDGARFHIDNISFDNKGLVEVKGHTTKENG